MDRLAELFKTFDAMPLLFRISNVGVIAGGAALYAKCPSVNVVGDIDVFVTTKDDFFNIVNSFSTIFGLDCVYQTSSRESTSIANVCIVGETVPFQIIYRKFDTVETLIDDFDLDYIKVAFHKGHFVVLPEAQIAIEKKCVGKVACGSTRYERLIKTAQKGFTVPIFGELGAPLELGTVSLKTLQSKLMYPLKNRDYTCDDGKNNLRTDVDVAKLQVVGFEMSALMDWRFVLDAGTSTVTDKTESLTCKTVGIAIKWHENVKAPFPFSVFEFDCKRPQTGQDCILVVSCKSVFDDSSCGENKAVALVHACLQTENIVPLRFNRSRFRLHCGDNSIPWGMTMFQLVATSSVELKRSKLIQAQVDRWESLYWPDLNDKDKSTMKPAEALAFVINECKYNALKKLGVDKKVLHCLLSCQASETAGLVASLEKYTSISRKLAAAEIAKAMFGTM